MQCMSTTAVVRRETGGGSWPIAQLVGMNVMAWICAFAAYHTALVFF
jgi:Fe2+ transport system protein B